MGKPFDYQYYFADSCASYGTMTCAACNTTIDDSVSDWMSYKRSSGKTWDWKNVFFHRDCRVDQSGWEKIEKERIESENRHARLLSEMKKFAEKNGITDAQDFAELAAESLGVTELFYYYQ